MNEQKHGLPHGGELINLIATKDRAVQLRELSRDFTSIILTDSQLSDLELLASGAYSPLTGFLSHDDYKHVLTDMLYSLYDSAFNI